MLRKSARRRKAQAVRWWLGAAPLAVIFSAGTLMGAPTILDFEDVAAGTTVTAQYGPRGVLFQNHFLDTDAAAHSGTHVLRSASLADELFTPIPIAMTFTSAQARVKLFAESTGAALNGTLTAFDASDSVVAQDGPKLVAAGEFTTMFEVVDQDTTASITRAELRLENGIYFAIDDLEFEGEPPAPPPPTPPVVQITSPTDGAELDVSTIDIAGTVTGEGLLSSVALTLLYSLPPESTAPPFTSDLSLTGTGTTRQFSLPGFTGVPLGPITVTVTAQNFAAQQGTDSITFTNLPAAIRSRFDQEKGAATLGEFRFGLVLNGCKIAVYEQGAISADDAGVTYVVRGDILTKWLSLRTLANPEGLGCPQGEERDGPGGSRAQEFDNGNIYTHPTIGTFSVPSVFVEAIKNRGGEDATGIPIAEPTSSTGAMQTWLFQRFTRPDHPLLEPSTLEIRGNPPRLWIERQGWDLSLPVETTGTIYEDFKCSDVLGPCTVTEKPQKPEPIHDAGDLFCYGTTYAGCDAQAIPPSAGCEVGRVPEWSPILGDLDDSPSERAGNYISTPLFGVARGSHMAHEDNPLTHENFYGCPEDLCPSDWNVSVFVIGTNAVPPFTSIVAENTYVECKYEDFYARYAEVFMDWPQVGDLFFAAGRWIIDCGHTPYRTELHPVFMWAKMKAEQYQGHLATRCDIWVNGWYPGDPIDFDIFPPPRPSPDATLTLTKPVDADAALDVTVEFSFAPGFATNHVHVRFTASPREVEITGAGEMLWDYLRGYEGQWYIYWNE